MVTVLTLADRNESKLRLFVNDVLINNGEWLHIVCWPEMSDFLNLWVGRGCKFCAVSNVLEDFHVYSELIDLYG